MSDEIKAAEAEWKDSNAKYQSNLKEYEQLLKTNPKMELDANLKRLQEAFAKVQLNIDVKFIVPDTISEQWLKEAGKNLAPWKQATEVVVKEATELAAKVKRPEGETVTKEKLEQLDKQVEDARQRRERLEATINQALDSIAAQGDLCGRLVEAREAQAKAQADGGSGERECLCSERT